MCCGVLSRVFEILWTVAHQASLTIEFSRQEYWSRLSCPTLRDLPHPGIEQGRGWGGRSWVGAGARLQVPVLCAHPPGGHCEPRCPMQCCFTRPTGLRGGAAIFHEELWSEVPGVRPLHAAPWKQVTLD